MIVNGNLQFHTLGSGELQNAIMERLAADPSGSAGRLYYNNVSNTYRFYDGTVWSELGSTGFQIKDADNDTLVRTEATDGGG